jgi:glyoxylase I family protein
MITGIHHVSLLISSEGSLDFYKLLGFKEILRKERKTDTVVLLEGYGIQLEIFIDSSHPKLPSGAEEPLGVRHFALKVDNIEQTVEQLAIDHTDIGTDWQGIRYCYITDPDGNEVELHE